MKTNTERLAPATLYHLYNRGLNGEAIFKEARNYAFFLKQYAKYIEPIAETYAYCLLGNHFHFLIRTKSEEDILAAFATKKSFPVDEAALATATVDEVPNLVDRGRGKGDLVDRNARPRTPEFYLSNQFAKFFNSYAQTFRNAYGGTGGLFETPFRRVAVNDESYFSKMIWYIHRNPQTHGLVPDFREYPHSSYQSHLLAGNTKLKRDEVLGWFGNKSLYAEFHLNETNRIEIGGMALES